MSKGLKCPTSEGLKCPTFEGLKSPMSEVLKCPTSEVLKFPMSEGLKCPTSEGPKSLVVNNPNIRAKKREAQKRIVQDQLARARGFPIEKSHRNLAPSLLAFRSFVRFYLQIFLFLTFIYVFISFFPLAAPYFNLCF